MSRPPLNYRKMSDREISELAAQFRPDTPQGSGPREEIECRKSQRQFWKKDIVAWLALVISIISLIVTFLHRK